MAGARDGRGCDGLDLLGRIEALDDRPLVAHGLGLGLVVLASLVRLQLEPWLAGAVPFAFHYPVVVVAALLGGVAVGCTALAATLAAVWWLVLPAGDGPPAQDLLGMALFAGSSVIVIVCAAILRRARAGIAAIERRRLQAMAEEQRRLSLVLDNLSEAVTAVFLDTGVTLRNRAWLRFHGVASFAELPGWGQEEVGSLFELFTADGRRLARDEFPLPRALRGERFEALELRVRRIADGRQWWGSYNGAALRDAGGRVQAALISMRDISDRKAAEQRQDLLLRELAHRVKNMLALIGALARQTGGSTPRTADFLPAFEARLAALGAAHDLLTATGWEGVALPDLARAALAGHQGGERVRLDLPPVRLPPALAQTLGLVLHELATNAHKYGALSTEAGRVDFSAACADGRLDLLWRETGGPPVTPPTRQGFGTVLVTQGVRHQHRGEIEVSWRPEGLLCRLRVPLEAEG
ncbi:MAG: HWE histidine kinase domain-containing protein [Geminicoccaceae bacterium]